MICTSEAYNPCQSLWDCRAIWRFHGFKVSPLPISTLFEVSARQLSLKCIRKSSLSRGEGWQIKDLFYYWKYGSKAKDATNLITFCPGLQSRSTGQNERVWIWKLCNWKERLHSSSCEKICSKNMGADVLEQKELCIAVAVGFVVKLSNIAHYMDYIITLIWNNIYITRDYFIHCHQLTHKHTTNFWDHCQYYFTI